MEGMKNACFWLALLIAAPLAAQPVPSQESQPPQTGWRERTPEERAAWREERRRLHEAWREMSIEERHRLRRDIRDAGEQLYPRHGFSHRRHERGSP